MKRNLIIFLFTLLLGGLTCCNYSYASTVNVPESVCKNIEDELNDVNSAIHKEYSQQYDALYRDQTISQLGEMKDAPDDEREEIVQEYRDSQNQFVNNQLANVCKSRGCTYFHDKCVACPGIRLNTDIPFIGNCIPTDSQSEIFPVFIGGLIKFATSLLLLVGFICIIVGGVMVACGKDKEGKDLIKKVVYAMALLGASGVILKMINPNFFN